MGIALGSNNVVGERWGYDVDALAMEKAVERGAVDNAADLNAPGLRQALQDAELIILSAPVRQSLKILEEIAPLLQKGALVTDVGSTKKKIVRAMEDLLPPGVTGIGGHPMSGSEKSGIAAADAALLKNAAYLLTPARNTPPKKLEKLQTAIRAIGAIPFILDPEEHDKLAALISHLPHLVAVTLVNTLKNSGYEQNLLHAFAGNGFKDTTRIAMGEPSVWYDIFSTNKSNLNDALNSFLKELNKLCGNLDKGNEQEVIKILAEGKLWRQLFS
ncbi:MAG TPA: prephenate dehydrogenase [Firmicutes bacterium]|nr:prephenate dehydrogenase [Bacillota bacterium]